MEFSAPLASFIKPLQSICSIAGTAASTDDISQNVVLTVKDGNLTLRATDYRIELSYTVPVADVSPGEILVSASKLRETLSKLPPAAMVTFVCDTETEDELATDLLVATGQTRFKIRTRKPDNFPDFDPAHEEVVQVLSLKQGQLKRIIDSTIFCVMQEDFRTYLRGIRLEAENENLTVFTSDGHRMAMIETCLLKPIAGAYAVTLIRPCAVELCKILEQSDAPIDLAFTKNNVTIFCNGYKLSSKLLICESFPNLRGALPRGVATIIAVNRTELKSEISKVSVLSSKRINGVNLVFNDGFLNLRSENSEHEVATSQMPVNYQGAPIDITLNASYVNEVLGAMQSEFVNFNFTSPLVNALLCPADETSESELHTRYVISRIVV